MLIILSLSLKCSWKSSLVSKIIPKCLWVVYWITTVLLKFNDGWFGLLSFLEKVTSCACLFGSRLKLISHWNVHLSSLDHHLNSLLIEWYPGQPKREGITSKQFGFETKLSERSLINIKKNRGPRIDPWQTPTLTLPQEEYWLFVF